MHRYFFTTKDAFINSGSNSITGEDYTDKNTGQDEILELSHEYHTSGGLHYPSRILIKFKDSEIKNVFENKMPNPTASYSASIELFAAEQKSKESPPPAVCPLCCRKESV